MPPNGASSAIPPIRVAILGAGPAGLAAAWGLTEPQPAQPGLPPVDVTVYEASWRAGGKCAGARLPSGQRIVQNGTHYMFGVYFNALGMVRSAHQAIGDARYGEAADFVPRELIALKRFLLDPAWENWVFRAPTKAAGLPTEAHAFDSPEQYLDDVFRWLKDQLSDAGLLPTTPLPAWVEALELDELAALGAATLANLGGKVLGDLLDLLIQRALALAADPSNQPLLAAIAKAVAVLRFATQHVLKGSTDPKVIRIRILFDFVLTVLIGIIADGVLSGSIASVDDHDLADWLASHGAQTETVLSPLVRAWYDAVAAYENGDPSVPRLSAAAFLQTVVPALAAYRTSFCYQMKAEAAESFVLPVYEALRRRGVKFRFLHELVDVVPRADGVQIDKLVLRVPRLPAGPGYAETALASYDPLVDTPMLNNNATRKCWPPGPKPPFDFLGEISVSRPLLRRPFGPTRDEVVRLHGTHFDRVVFALPHTEVGRVAQKLMAQKPAWKNLYEQLPSVETKSLRLWLRTPFPDIAWDPDPTTRKTPPVLSAYSPLFSTWEDSGQQLDLHAPTNDPPRSIATVFGPLAASRYPVHCQLIAWLLEWFQRMRARGDAHTFLVKNAGKLWPGLVDAAGQFRWSELVPAGSDASALDAQWVIANTGASERYTHAAPRTFVHRLRSADTGYTNLGVAGEWTRFWPATANVELAVISGLRAGYDIRGVTKAVRSEKGFFPS